MRVLVTGAAGQLVTSILERAAVLPDVHVATVSRPTLDMAAPASVAPALAHIDFDLIVNAAAYTAVDRAESEEDVAHRINSDSAGEIASVAAARGKPVIQISTDYVFDGVKTGAWQESDPTNPLSAYGRTKLAGEEAVLAANPQAVILRTAWVYSPFGANFAKTMLRLAGDRSEVSVVADQTGTPTCALDIADGVLAVARNLIQAPGRSEQYGVFHMTARTSGQAPSWADFAQEIFEASQAAGGPRAAVKRIPSSEYPTPARRPANSWLNCRKLEHIHGVALPLWEASVPPVVRRLLGVA